MKKIRYLTSEEVEWSHDRILESTGGERGDLAQANLEFVFDRMRDVGEGLDYEKTIVKMAAFLLHSLVTYHPFINGNKRTALEVAQLFLELNGYTANAKPDEAFSLLSEVAAGKASQTQVEYWIGTNLAKKKAAVYQKAMTQRLRKEKDHTKIKIDLKVRKIVEKNLRRDRELLERLAKI